MSWLGSKHQYQNNLFAKGVNALNGFLNAWPEWTIVYCMGGPLLALVMIQMVRKATKEKQSTLLILMHSL